MTGTDWILLDTETSGLLCPIYCVELAAQRMRGVAPVGEPFRALLNHDVAIDPRAQAIHGYSREYLRRHGRNPADVHEDFIRYAGNFPIVAYNLSFDWGRVLAPELERLSLVGGYSPGFCALTLARRSIHETAGHGLQRLRAHFFPYHRGAAHRALDDVTVTIRLIAEIVWPRLERAGLRTFAEVAAFSRAGPIASCLERLRPPEPAHPESARSDQGEDPAQALEAKIDTLGAQASLEMHEIDALRGWLAHHRELQSLLAMRCRGLLEISFPASALNLLERIQLHRRLRGFRAAYLPHPEYRRTKHAARPSPVGLAGFGPS